MHPVPSSKHCFWHRIPRTAGRQLLVWEACVLYRQLDLGLSRGSRRRRELHRAYRSSVEKMSVWRKLRSRPGTDHPKIWQEQLTLSLSIFNSSKSLLAYSDRPDPRLLVLQSRSVAYSSQSMKWLSGESPSPRVPAATAL